jgi:Na+-transporting NADH:ubiquinone oxidoreductase subunit NqrB
MQAEYPMDPGLALRRPWVSLRRHKIVPGGPKATHILSVGTREIPLVLVGWKDARWGQIIAHASFNTLGLTIVDFRVTVWQLLSVVTVACLTEILFMARKDKVLVFPASGLISGLGMGFLFRSDTLFLHPLAGFMAIASKYWILIDGKHIYNPTNFSIVLLLLLFPDNAWITGGDWGTYFVYVLEVVNAAIFLIYRVRRFHVCVAWYGTLAALLMLQVAFTDLHFDTVESRLQNGVLVIFTFFMITDPKTSPDTYWGRIVYASAVGVVTFILMVAEVRFAPFFALFFITSLVPLVDKLASGRRFMWETEHSVALAGAAPAAVEIPRSFPGLHGPQPRE